MRLDLDVEATDITDPSPVSMVVLVSHLSEVLPKYTKRHNPTSQAPGQELHFTAELGRSGAKHVELKNKHGRTLQYRIKLVDPGKVFGVERENELVSIPPKGTLKLKVTYSPRRLGEGITGGLFE